MDQYLQSHFVSDAIGGTLARDHQSTVIYYAGKYKRTYITYMDERFDAIILYYDHNSNTWSDSVRIDHCIADVGWAKGLKDCHNIPNLWIQKDGTIHVLYGVHSGPIKYARSASSENIYFWKTGMRISDHATYPYVTELPDGELLLFYRYSPTGGYSNPYLAIQKSCDGGRTWSEMNVLLQFKTGCKMNGNNAIYDFYNHRVCLSLAVPVTNKIWRFYQCYYDIETEMLYSPSGKCLGEFPSEDDFNRLGCRLGNASGGDQIMWNNNLYYFIQNNDDNYIFGKWDGIEFVKNEMQYKMMAGVRMITAFPYTEDGKTYKVFGLRDISEPVKSSYADLYVWTSTDEGRTWDGGRRLLGYDELGYGFQGLSMTMNYQGSGPFIIVGEGIDDWPAGVERTPENHYDNPGRKQKRLVALDINGRPLV